MICFVSTAICRPFILKHSKRTLTQVLNAVCFSFPQRRRIRPKQRNSRYSVPYVTINVHAEFRVRLYSRLFYPVPVGLLSSFPPPPSIIFQPAVVHLQGQETTIQVREGRDVLGGPQMFLSAVFGDFKQLSPRIQVHLQPTRPVLHSLRARGLDPDVRWKSLFCYTSPRKLVISYGAVEASGFSLTLRLNSAQACFRRGTQTVDSALLLFVCEQQHIKVAFDNSRQLSHGT